MIRKIAKCISAGTFLFLPLYSVKVFLFNISFPALDILEMVSIAVNGWLFFRERRNLIRGLSQKQHLFLLGFVCIFFGSVFSAFLTEGFSARELGIVKSWIVLPFLFVILSYGNGFLRLGIKAYAVSACAVSFFAVCFCFFGGLTYDGRLSGWYESPNQLAMYIAPATILLYGIIRFSREGDSQRTTLRKKLRKKQYPVVFGMFFVCGITLLLTQSLGGIASVVLAGGSMEIKNFFQKEKSSGSFRKKILLVILVLSVFCIALSPLLLGKIGERSSLASRVMIWKSSLLMLKEHPIFGIGPGNFQEKYLEHQRFFPPYLEWAVPHPHNTVLAFWVFSGVMGMLGFFLVVSLVSYSFWNQGKVFFARNVGGMGAFISILFFGCVDTVFWGNALSVLFWMFALSLVFGGKSLSLPAISKKACAQPVENFKKV